MVTKTEQVDQIEHAPVSIAADTLDERVLGRPSKTQMLPIVGWKVHEPILGAIILPLKLVRFPIVLWGALQFTFTCSCFLTLNLTQSQALAVAPYNFTPAEIGYTNLALFVGTCFSLATAGPFSDWVSQRATVRNNGIREPEMRLPALLPFALCNLVGCVVASLGFQYGWPWEAVIVVGFGFVGIQVAAISGISINYVVRPTLCRSCIFTSLTVPLDRLLQTGCRRISRMCNRVQECVGLWYGQVPQQLDCRGRIYPSPHDHRGFELRLHVPGCCPSVFLWQEA